MSEQIIYAIGDIHGEAERLAALHAAIFARHEWKHSGAAMRLIHLGDYVDRGPDSFAVIEMLIALEKRDDIGVVNLRGNHEQMMLDAFGSKASDYRSHWLVNGGDATLQSYVRRGLEVPPNSHLKWLDALPTIHFEASHNLIFVHAGVNPKTFPDCDAQIHLWTRSPRFFNTSGWDEGGLKGWQVVHGHTPTDDFEPEVSGVPPRRFNLDTGAVYGGKLTAGIFAPGEQVDFISV